VSRTGERKLTIPPGEFAQIDLPFTVSDRAEEGTLTLVTLKGGSERFREDRMVFQVTDEASTSRTRRATMSGSAF